MSAASQNLLGYKAGAYALLKTGILSQNKLIYNHQPFDR